MFFVNILTELFLWKIQLLVKLIIFNKDNVAEEFDSFDLNREKVLFPKRKSTIFIGPLKPGNYEYFGEYFPNTARGMIIVEADNAH